MPGSLLSYDDAIAVIRERTRPLGRAAAVDLTNAAGLACAEPVYADDPYPRFDNSAVDGYVLGHREDGVKGTRLRLEGSVAAGEAGLSALEPGTAARILTGAQVPDGAFGVVMQEDVALDGGAIVLNAGVAEGANIRLQGIEVKRGDTLIEPGTIITPAVASLLALAGQTCPLVFERPKVSVITTGDELVPPSIVPVGSQIRDTNSVMLTMLSGPGADSIHVVDDYEQLKQAVLAASKNHDLMLLAGGASVGDRDFVGRVVREVGEVYFHGVSIRPGKPVLFGQVGDCLVFGLPGNPTSAFVGFHIFTNYAMRILSGHREPELRWLTFETAFNHRAAGRTDFPRVKLRDGLAHPGGEQGSFGLTSPAFADGIARFPADVDTSAGYRCPVLLV